MKACSAWTRTSRAVTRMRTTNDVAEYKMPIDRLSRYQVASENTSSSTCPASMFANSRTDSVNGRTRTFEKNSIGTSSGRIHQGDPCGTVSDFQ